MQWDKLILISCTLGLVQLHIGVAGFLPGCITEYRISQPDIQLRNQLSGYITGMVGHPCRMFYYLLFHIDLLPMFEWLLCYLWRESYDKFNSELKLGKVLYFKGV